MGRAEVAFSDYWVLRTPCARPRAWDHLAEMSKPGLGVARSRAGSPGTGASGRQHLGQGGSVPAPATEPLLSQP